MSQSAGATKTKYHRLPHSLGGWKSDLRTPAWWGSGESLLPSWQVTALTVLSHGEEKERDVSSCGSVTQSCPTLYHPWTATHQSSLSFTISRSLLKFMSIELVIPFNHLVLCHPLLLLSIFPSISVFSNESALLIRWPKYRSFSFSISPSYEYSTGLIFSVKTLTLQWLPQGRAKRTYKGYGRCVKDITTI